MTGPHLSGLEFRGHMVTVGKTTSFIEITTVFEAIGCVDHATKRNTNVSIDIFKGPFTNYIDKPPILDILYGINVEKSRNFWTT